MTEEVRRRCLEPFFTTKGEQGTGLGLSMVYGIIRRHNGTVDIQSEAGKGTVFSISIPLHKGGERKSPKNEPVFQVSPLRILFADDEPAIRNVILEYLKRDGHIVEAASSGAEALSKFYAGRFDLVITDRAMPEMSGEQLAAKIKEIAAKKPIILLSGTADLIRESGQPHKSFDAIVDKPVTLEQLRSAIAKLFLKQ
jgi:CheY-like chemotaxis protein